MSEDKFQIRKEKVIKWFKKEDNLLLVLVLVFGAILRIKYFLVTKSQPLWWDELAYGSLAKNFITHIWDGTPIIVGESLIRPPLFPILWSFLLRIGFEEVGVRFLLELVPSIVSIFAVYLVGKELYNKKVGLLSAFIFSVLWIHLFYTGRLLTNVPAMPFLFFSVYYFVKSFKPEFKGKEFFISIFLLSIATLMRYPNGLFFFAYLFFIVLTVKKIKLIKNPKFWMAGLIGLVPIFIFFAYNYVDSGNIFPALLGGDYLESGEDFDRPIGFHVLNFIPGYLQTTFFIFFLAGLVISLFDLAIGYDQINKKNILKAHLLILSILILFYSYFIFYIRAAEDRWLFPASLSLVCISGFGMNHLFQIGKKYNKILSIALLAGVLIFGSYQQVTFADKLINDRKSTFLQMKQGFEWIRENTEEDSVILGQGIEPYSVYYANRRYVRIPEEDKSKVDEIEADYLVVHFFVPQPPYIGEYLDENQDKWRPVSAYFFDAEKQNPAFIAYKNIKN